MKRSVFLIAVAPLVSSVFALQAEEGRRFSFGSESIPGFQKVTAEDVDDGQRSYGFLSGAVPSEAGTGSAVVSDRPFVFFVNMPEGNYRVKAVLGAGAKPAATTIKAESRRLMVEKVEVAPGKKETREFTVNVRQPTLSGGRMVSLKPGEKGPPLAPRWDERLTLEFNGAQPALETLEIVPEPKAVTVFLAGDSTVTEQAREPWAGWGQMLSVFFDSQVAISNHAESGLALFSFRSQKRLEKILESLKLGDYVFVQFGHNDQKDKSPGAGAFTSYKQNLKGYVEDIRKRGGIPVLVTPMERRRWQGDTPQSTLTDYAEAVRQVGEEDKVAVIDLNAMSLKVYGALGPEESKKAFVYYPANTFPGQDKPLKDDTHHCGYGAYELARCMVMGIREKVPELAAHLKSDVAPFDPSKPDAPGKFTVPASPAAQLEVPAGS